MYFGVLPQSEFYGIALGYAIGLFLSAALHLDSQAQNLLFAAAGYFIGRAYDMKYCMEPDAPPEEEPDTPPEKDPEEVPDLQDSLPEEDPQATLQGQDEPQ